MFVVNTIPNISNYTLKPQKCISSYYILGIFYSLKGLIIIILIPAKENKNFKFSLAIIMCCCRSV